MQYIRSIEVIQSEFSTAAKCHWRPASYVGTTQDTTTWSWLVVAIWCHRFWFHEKLVSSNPLRSNFEPQLNWEIRDWSNYMIKSTPPKKPTQHKHTSLFHKHWAPWCIAPHSTADPSGGPTPRKTTCKACCHFAALAQALTTSAGHQNLPSWPWKTMGTPPKMVSGTHRNSHSLKEIPNGSRGMGIVWYHYWGLVKMPLIEMVEIQTPCFANT